MSQLEEQMKTMMVRPGSVEGVDTGLKPTNQKKQSRKGRLSRDLLGTSEFQDNQMVEGAGFDRSDLLESGSERADDSPDPFRAGVVAGVVTGKVPFRAGVFVKAVGGDVTISKEGLKDDDSEAIVSLLSVEGAKAVTKLILGDNDLGDAAAVAIAEQLKSNQSLTYLSLHKNKIGHEGGMALAAALAAGCPKLKTLFLTQNPLSDEALSELSRAYAERPDEQKAPAGSLNGLVLDAAGK